MDPSMMQSAMEAMSRASPEQLEAARRQMASMSPDMMQEQMRMFQNMNPQQQADVRRQAASMGPPGAAAGQAGHSGPLQALNALKGEGNKLHTAGQYAAACTKYEQVLSSIQGDDSEAAAALTKSCTLNLSSCYLNQGKHQACIEACSRILASEASNRKALYRRGQAHLAASEAPAAVRDLRKALAAAPADEREIIRGKLEAAQKLLASQGLAAEPEEEQIEEINVQPPATARSAPPQTSLPQPAASSFRPAMPPNMAEQMRGFAEQMRANPAMAGQMQSMMQNMDPQQFKMMAQMSGMGDVPDISPEQLREASARMADMTPDDLARTADLAQAQQMRSGPAASANGNVSSTSAGHAEPSGRAAPPGNDAEASTSAPGAQPTPAAPASGGFDFSQAASMMQNNPDMMKQAMDMMASMPPEQMENLRRMATGAGGQAGRMGPGGMPDLSSLMNDPNMMANMQSMFTSVTPEQMVGMAKQAGVNLNEEQAAQISSQLKNLKPWQMQLLARGAAIVQWLQRVSYQQKMTALGVIVLLVALLLRFVGWL